MNTQQNPKLHNVIRFYFKVNNSKLKNKEKLQSQIELCVKRLIKNHNIKSEEIELKFGTVDDDFINDRCRLQISFKYE